VALTDVSHLEKKRQYRNPRNIRKHTQFPTENSTPTVAKLIYKYRINAHI